MTEYLSFPQPLGIFPQVTAGRAETFLAPEKILTLEQQELGGFPPCWGKGLIGSMLIFLSFIDNELAVRVGVGQEIFLLLILCVMETTPTQLFQGV